MDKKNDVLYAPPVDSAEHKEILEYAMNLVRTAEEPHKNLVPEWMDNYRAFMTLPTNNTPIPEKDWQSDVRTPYIAEQILTMLPRIVEGRPTIDILKNNSATSDDIVKAQKQYLRHVIHEDNFSFKSSLQGLNNLLFGIGYTKQSFLYETRKRSFANRFTGEIGSKLLVVNNRPTMTVGHPFDVMPDPAAQIFENARFIVWRTIVSVSQVHANKRRKENHNGKECIVGRYENTQHVKACGVDQRSEKFINEHNEYASWLNSAVAKRVEILEVFDAEKDCITTIANRSVVLRAHRMPWWHCQIPVSAMVTTPALGSVIGTAETYWMKPLQEHLHMMENHKMDNQRLQMDAVLLINDSIFDKDDFELSPGAKWPVNNPNDVQALQYAQPQLASEGDLQMLRGRLQSIVGSAYMTGGENPGMNQDTASGLLSIIEEGNRRVDYRMNLARIGYERALQQMLSDASQYLEHVVYVPGDSRTKDPIPVSPEDLAEKNHVRVTLGSETGLKSLRQQQVQNILMASQGLMGTPIPTPEGMKSFNPMPLIEIMADSVDRDPEEFLIDMQQLQNAVPNPAAQAVMGQEAAATPGVIIP